MRVCSGKRLQHGASHRGSLDEVLPVAVSARSRQTLSELPSASRISGRPPIDLSADQRRVVEHLAGGLLVLAPVGTGKTTVLAERLAHAVGEGIAPERTLCLTFTNRAARAVRDRLADRFPELAGRLVLRTFHSLCVDILRTEAKAAGLAADFTVCDDSDTHALLRRILGAGAVAAEAAEVQRAIELAKRDADVARLGWPVDASALFATLPHARQLRAAIRYQRGLAQWQTLDFADLVLHVRALFEHRPEVRQRWAEQFDLIQVDEVQDTHLSEYGVVRDIAAGSGNLACFGDVDQTIYEWRGADPDALLAAFQFDFAPVERLELRANYRGTRRLLNAASAFADSFHRRTHVEAAAGCPDGAPIRLTRVRDEVSEADDIALRVQHLAATTGEGFAFRRVAVLARTNAQCAEIARAFERAGLPHATAELAELFRRPVVKDAVAYLRLLANSDDTGSALRIWEQATHDVDSAILTRIRTDGEPIGLRLVDLFQPDTFALGDPLGRVVDAWGHGSLVVFDVETTGIAPHRDEIVEVAAVRLERGAAMARFHALLRPTVPVGVSERVHGLSDARLATEARDPGAVLAELIEFIGDDLLVGHNIGFDVRILAAQAGRLGLHCPRFKTADTLRIAPRFETVHPHSLEAYATALRLPHRPVHRAEPDVAATADLLAHCMVRAARTARARRALVAREGAPFRSIANALDGWQAAAETSRPAALLARVLDESGLLAQHGHPPGSGAALRDLLEVCARRDDAAIPPRDALRDFLAFVALAKGLDHLDEREDRVPIITIHQAKGLEFDIVFVPGMVQGGLPGYRAVQSRDEEEERRLFYVALTRARRQLFLSHAATNRWGRRARPSSFLTLLDPWLERGA